MQHSSGDQAYALTTRGDRVLAELGPAMPVTGKLDDAHEILVEAQQLFDELGTQMHPAQADVLTHSAHA